MSEKKGQESAEVDIYQWHIVGYATLGSMLCFFVNDWIDSHAPDYYGKEYYSFIGVPAKFLFIIPAVLNFILLFVIFRKLKPSPETPRNVTLVPILVAFIVSATQFVGFLGFSMKTMHLPLLLVNILIAGIVGFGSWTHFWSLSVIPGLSAERAEKERETRVTLFGSLLETATLLLISGGVVIMLTIASESDIVGMIPETRKWWPLGSAIFLFYLAYGIYCLFLIRFLATTGELSEHIVRVSKKKGG